MSTACVSWKSSSQCLAVFQSVSQSVQTEVYKENGPDHFSKSRCLAFFVVSCLLFGLCQPCRVGIVVYEGTGLGWCSGAPFVFEFVLEFAFILTL